MDERELYQLHMNKAIYLVYLEVDGKKMTFSWLTYPKLINSVFKLHILRFSVFRVNQWFLRVFSPWKAKLFVALVHLVKQFSSVSKS